MAAIVTRYMGLLVAVVNLPVDIIGPVVYPDPEQRIVVGFNWWYILKSFTNYLEIRSGIVVGYARLQFG